VDGHHEPVRRPFRQAALLALAAPLVAAVQAGAAPAREGELDSRLQAVAAAPDAARALALAREQGLRTAGRGVRVVVEGRGDVAGAVRAAGAEVARSQGQLVSALVPPAALERLAGTPGVSLVRAPHRPATAVVGQGVAKLNAPAWHAAGPPGFTGAGVRVAVIDLGFAGLAAAKAAGELPGDTELVDRCGGAVESTNHGVAVAEIVHDVAPGADLTLVCIGDEVDLAQAASDARARGAKVIVHSVIWFNTSRGDGSGAAGSPDAIAAAARANGILWVNAAGNHALKHWSGQFVDANGDGVHEFAGGDTTNGISVPSSGTVCAYLKWDAWPTTAADYDLELVLPDGTVVASSAVRQDGDDTPTEGLCTGGGGNPLALRIRRVSGAGSPRLDLFWVAPGSLEHQVAAGSIPEPASSPQVLAVGALCSHTGALQPYSSRGPTIAGRTKPDLASWDAVTSFVFGPSAACSGSAGFVGTSAAAPHVGGAAALVLESRPGLAPADLQGVLEGKAVDVAPPGPDNDTGLGRLLLSVDLPVAAATAAQAVEQTTARVTGTVEPALVRTTYRFEYGPTPALGSATGDATAGSRVVAAPLAGLTPQSTVHYRLVATNPFGTSTSPLATFATLAFQPPSAVTTAAVGVGAAGATLTATVNPNGKPTTVRFDFGPTAAYGAVSASVVLPAGNAPVPVAVAVAGLASATAYRFRVRAENELGTTLGGDAVVTTAAASGGGGGGAPADLVLTATADRSSATLGDTVLVRARVRLGNPTVSSGVSEAVLTATLPAGVELVATKANRGSGCSGAPTVACPLSFIAAGVEGEVELVLRLQRSGVASVVLSVRAAGDDANPADNTATVAVTVTATAVGAGTVDRKPPTIVLRRPSSARLQRATVRRGLATVGADVTVDEAARLRLRVLDLRSGRALALATPSRLAGRQPAAGARILEARLLRAGPVRLSAVIRRSALRPGGRYAVELVAVDAGGRSARLRLPFTLPAPVKR
jgi:hypothetical protein